MKVHEAGRIISVAVTVAVGVNADGRREVLGMAVGASEAETFWLDFLRTLKRRGLAGVRLVAERLRADPGQNVVVENRSSAESTPRSGHSRLGGSFPAGPG